jgi:hypothetical protein
MERLFLLVLLWSLAACATLDLDSAANVQLGGDWVLDSTLS